MAGPPNAARAARDSTCFADSVPSSSTMIASCGGVVHIGLTRMVMEFSWRIHPASAVPTVEVAGELDLESGPYLHEQLRSLIRAHGAYLAIDLSGVTFIDCSGVNALLASGRDAR